MNKRQPFIVFGYQVRQDSGLEPYDENSIIHRGQPILGTGCDASTTDTTGFH